MVCPADIVLTYVAAASRFSRPLSYNIPLRAGHADAVPMRYHCHETRYRRDGK